MRADSKELRNMIIDHLVDQKVEAQVAMSIADWIQMEAEDREVEGDVKIYILPYHGWKDAKVDMQIVEVWDAYGLIGAIVEGPSNQPLLKAA